MDGVMHGAPHRTVSAPAMRGRPLSHCRSPCTSLARTCFSGVASRGRANLRPGTRPLVVTTAEDVTTPTGVTLISAAGPADFSVADQRLQHGVFTFHLLMALRGHADADRDGSLGVRELFDYVVEKVPRHAARLDTRQRPTLWGAAGRGGPVFRLGKTR